jgi:hypothetical protein
VLIAESPLALFFGDTTNQNFKGLSHKKLPKLPEVPNTSQKFDLPKLFIFAVTIARLGGHG